VVDNILVFNFFSPKIENARRKLNMFVEDYENESYDENQDYELVCIGNVGTPYIGQFTPNACLFKIYNDNKDQQD